MGQRYQSADITHFKEKMRMRGGFDNIPNGDITQFNDSVRMRGGCEKNLNAGITEFNETMLSRGGFNTNPNADITQFNDTKRMRGGFDKKPDAGETLRMRSGFKNDPDSAFTRSHKRNKQRQQQPSVSRKLPQDVDSMASTLSHIDLFRDSSADMNAPGAYRPRPSLSADCKTCTDIVTKANAHVPGRRKLRLDNSSNAPFPRPIATLFKDDPLRFLEDGVQTKFSKAPVGVGRGRIWEETSPKRQIGGGYLAEMIEEAGFGSANTRGKPLLTLDGRLTQKIDTVTNILSDLDMFEDAPADTDAPGAYRSSSSKRSGLRTIREKEGFDIDLKELFPRPKVNLHSKPPGMGRGGWKDSSRERQIGGGYLSEERGEVDTRGDRPDKRNRNKHKQQLQISGRSSGEFDNMTSTFRDMDLSGDASSDRLPPQAFVHRSCFSCSCRDCVL